MILEALHRSDIPGLGDITYDETYSGPEKWDHWVYRIHCADRLLYIGSAHDLVGRMQVHASSWSNRASACVNLYASHVTAERVNGRSAARAREREAITAEAPLFNQHHNLGRCVFRDEEAWLEMVPTLRRERDAWLTMGAVS